MSLTILNGGITVVYVGEQQQRSGESEVGRHSNEDKLVNSMLLKLPLGAQY
jgi:hypothetical protein